MVITVNAENGGQREALKGAWRVKEPLIRNRWIEFSDESGFALTLEPWSYFDERPLLHIKLPIRFNLFLHLPFKTGKEECETPRFGIYWFDQSLWFCFWRKIWAWHMPWSWNFYKRWERITGYRDNDFHWVEVPKGAPYGFIGAKETHDYTYVLKSGEVQNRKATIYVSRMEWRMRKFMWLSLVKLVRDSIEVSFDGEVGERTGSWKGGTTGCGYDLKSGETALECLRRMEKERIFK